MDLIIALPHICVTDVTGTNKSGLKSPITLSSCEDLLILVPSSDSHYRVGTTSSWSEKPTLIKVSTKHLMRCIWGLFIFLHTGYLLKEYNLQDNYWRSDPPWKTPEQDEPLHLTPAVCNESFQYPVWMQDIFTSFLSDERRSNHHQDAQPPVLVC